MKIGIIGTGKHGTRYANHIINDVNGLELAVISRRSPLGLEQARQWGVRYHARWQDLVNDPQVDAVISVTPPSLNVDVARQCVASGKPLLMEKPLAVDLAAGAEIVDLFHRAGVPLTVAQTLRYNAVIQALRGSLAKVGTLYAFSACHRLEPSSLSWLEDPKAAGAGVILHTAVHMFDALRFITGREVVRVRSSKFQVHNPRLEDFFTSQVEMEGGVVGTVDASKIGRARTGRYEFIGEKGELHGEQIHGWMSFTEKSAIEQIAHDPLTGTLVPLLRDWLLFLSGKLENPISGEEGLAALAICDACLRSATLDDWVVL